MGNDNIIIRDLKSIGSILGDIFTIDIFLFLVRFTICSVILQILVNLSGNDFHWIIDWVLTLPIYFLLWAWHKTYALREFR